MQKVICIYIGLTVFLAVIPSTLFAQVIAPEVETLLRTAPVSTEIPVIITKTDGVDVTALRAPSTTLLRSAIVSTLRDQAELSLVPLINFLEKNGARRVRELWLINSVAAIVPASTVEKLKTYPGISVVRLDEVIRIPEAMPAVVVPLEWNISAVGAGELWNLGFTGSNVVVASMDSGVDINHNDLSGRWRGGTNSWYDPNGEHPLTPTDKNGHGTGTTSVMVGGDATGSSIGMAPGAQWIAVKIFNDAGVAENSAIHLGFQWLLDPDGDPNTDDAPDVINNSWGFRELVDRCYLEFQTDIQTLKAAGIAVVFSAGNEGPFSSTSISPANNPESFAVGAVSSNLNIAGFSSRGPSACILDNDFFPEVVAPGVNIKVADRTFGGIFPNLFAYLDGTSFAAPHVAGGMALLKEAFPNLSPLDLESALTQSAADLGSVGPDDDYGYGMIDVLAAYRTLVPCTDGDDDGYFAEAVCGTAQDCDDGDLTIYPGAPEIKHDGIDQDCNGYDLTIEIISAVYRSDNNELEVIATSILADQASLTLDGFGPMVWNAVAGQWEIAVSDVVENPITVTVSGPEGEESTTTQECTNTCLADFSDDGFVNFDDLALLRANFGTDCSQLPPGQECIGDANGDGYVNFADLAQLRADFGRSDCLVCN